MIIYCITLTPSDRAVFVAALFYCSDIERKNLISLFFVI
jgi:hypothetical protein